MEGGGEGELEEEIVEVGRRNPLRRWRVERREGRRENEIH